VSVVQIDALDHEGHGICRVEGKVTFVDGALPGETAEISVFRKHPKYDSANAVRILKASSQRATPKCAHYGRCGGCVLQHLEVSAQVAAKQRILEENLQRIGKVKPEIILPALYGPAWGYRHRARFSVKRVDKKGGALVGFHEKKSWFIADMQHCEVLPPPVASLFMPMRELIPQLSNSDRIPQIELAIGETSTVLVFRLLNPWNDTDKEIVRAFADRYNVEIWVQPKGPDTAVPFYPENGMLLQYSLPEFNVVHPFRPTEFTQVNPHINRALVHRAITMLAPQAHEHIADFFCGLGNFTLPIARSGAQVVGIEGSQALVGRARENALLNGLSNVKYAVDNLFEMTPEKYAALGHFDKLLIDPPRDGAMELVKSLPTDKLLRRIVYISCNPATLARDAEVLCHVKGYALKAAGIANMFPHTAHVESIALFERP
jgi:23S rRNA (uracil1939-C5)-methyltransferase